MMKRLFEELISDDDNTVISLKSTDDDVDCKDDECVECFELYNETSSTADWIQCISDGKVLRSSCFVVPSSNVSLGGISSELIKMWGIVLQIKNKGIKFIGTPPHRVDGLGGSVVWMKRPCKIAAGQRGDHKNQISGVEKLLLHEGIFYGKIWQQNYNHVTFRRITFPTSVAEEVWDDLAFTFSGFALMFVFDESRLQLSCIPDMQWVGVRLTISVSAFNLLRNELQFLCGLTPTASEARFEDSFKNSKTKNFLFKRGKYLRIFNERKRLVQQRISVGIDDRLDVRCSRTGIEKQRFNCFCGASRNLMSKSSKCEGNLKSKEDWNMSEHANALLTSHKVDIVFMEIQTDANTRPIRRFDNEINAFLNLSKQATRFSQCNLQGGLNKEELCAGSNSIHLREMFKFHSIVMHKVLYFHLILHKCSGIGRSPSFSIRSKKKKTSGRREGFSFAWFDEQRKGKLKDEERKQKREKTSSFKKVMNLKRCLKMFIFDMEQITTQQRIEEKKHYYKNNNSPTSCVRDSSVIIGRTAAPTVWKIIRKLKAEK
ncbi:hypothetical protein C0J52_17466 [Blattella germanica]|nr:hypothetical protein C0J52_17466 [Blattella germanica]